MADGPRAVIVPSDGGHTVEGPVGGPLTFKIREVALYLLTEGLG